MKMNKFISKGLVLGILLNNLSVVSNANNIDIPSRYQTLEGEFITINDSKVGNLEEIEIFGNTVQRMASKNLFSSNLEKGYIVDGGYLCNSDYAVRSSDYIEVKPNTVYSMTVIGYSGAIYIHEYDENFNIIGQEKVIGGRDTTFETYSDTKYLKVNSSNEVIHSLSIYANFQLNEGSKLLDYDTYQETNLEDIKSVGDLYVDEDGNPILDNQGREQYKINLLSRGKNLFNKDDILITSQNCTFENNDGLLTITPNNYNDKNYAIYIKFNLEKGNYFYSGDATGATQFRADNYNGKIIYNLGAGTNRTISLSKDTDYIVLNFAAISSGLISFDLNSIQIEKSNVGTSYEKYVGQEVSILIPTQLQKVGDVADRLYWDNEKGRYVIEKNIWMDSFDTNDWSINKERDNVIVFTRPLSTMNLSKKYDLMKSSYYHTLCTLGKWVDINLDWENLGHRFLTNDYFAINIPRNLLETEDLNGFIKYLDSKDKYIYYVIEPKIIETNITSRLQIPMYEGQTNLYIETENKINPTLKITIDRIQNISEEQVDIVEAEPTSFNLSKARYFVNQMEESALKDQLQARLNQISNLNDLYIESKSSSANLDVYIKANNMLSMSLNTNSIMFEGYSGVEELELKNAIEVSINSSLPYDLSASIESNIYNNDKTEDLGIDLLKIKESNSDDYNGFANTSSKIILKENCNFGNNNKHSIDLKLDSKDSIKADVYKTTIKIEAEQK